MRRTPAALAVTSALVLYTPLTSTVPTIARSSSSAHGYGLVQPGGFTKQVLVTGLGGPYEIAWGPDGYLWVTEKSGLKVTRVNPKTGAKSTAGSLPQAVHSGQDGVLGLAFHPDLLRDKGHDYVYVSYTYQTTIPAAVTKETRRTKIVRYTYDARTQRLQVPIDVITGMPGSTDHQAARLRFGPDSKLYYTIDQGANRGSHAMSTARTPTTKSISYAKGGNYGWPHVAGYRDDKAYTYNNWSASAPTPCADLTYSDLQVPPSVPRQTETGWKRSFIAPIHTFGTVNTGFNFADRKCAAIRQKWVCSPTVAPSSLEYYQARPGTGVPGWNNSLLMTTLKDGTVYQLQLTNTGTIGKVTKLWKDQNRYRDTAVSSDGKSVFVATDNEGPVRDANGAPASDLKNPGSIVVFRWHP